MELERPPQHGNGDLLSRLVAAVTTLGLSSHLSPHPTPRSRTLTHNTKLNPPRLPPLFPFFFSVLSSFPLSPFVATHTFFLQLAAGAAKPAASTPSLSQANS